jgi:hypothetical protein
MNFKFMFVHFAFRRLINQSGLTKFYEIDAA